MFRTSWIDLGSSFLGSRRSCSPRMGRRGASVECAGHLRGTFSRLKPKLVRQQCCCERAGCRIACSCEDVPCSAARGKEPVGEACHCPWILACDGQQGGNQTG